MRKHTCGRPTLRNGACDNPVTSKNEACHAHKGTIHTARNGQKYQTTGEWQRGAVPALSPLTPEWAGHRPQVISQEHEFVLDQVRDTATPQSLIAQYISGQEVDGIKPITGDALAEAQTYAMQNPNADELVFVTVFTRNHLMNEDREQQERVLVSLAANEKTPPHIVGQLLNSTSRAVRVNAAANPSCPHEALARTLRHDPEVRRAMPGERRFEFLYDEMH